MLEEKKMQLDSSKDEGISKRKSGSQTAQLKKISKSRKKRIRADDAIEVLISV